MKKILFGLIICIILFVFRVWFLPSTIVGGDTVQIFAMDFFSPLPSLWDGVNNNGFGAFVGPFSNAQIITSIIWLLGNVLHFDWSAIERIVFLFPEIVISVLVSLKVTNYFLGKKVANVVAPLILLANTYFLLLMAGGQFVVSFSYILLPYVFYRFVILFSGIIHSELDRNNLIKESFIFSVLLSVEVIFDIRFTFLLVVSIILYFLYNLLFHIKEVVKKVREFFIFALVFPILFVLFLHGFWIIPTLLVHQDPLQQLGSAYTSVSAAKYLSFATFENAIGLLHPNWPENIFGFTHFMKPEFLIFPLIAFASLLFIQKTNKEEEKEKQRNILFFVLLGIVGIFLAKGANDPFGGLYLWMFDHVPGFVMFRDPTKWYVFIVLSYLILIPFSLDQIATRLRKIKFSQSLLLSCFIAVFCWTIRPAVMGQLPGLLQLHTIPKEYISLASYLSSDKTFSRVLWVPSTERFGYFSRQHPSVNAITYFKATSLSQVLLSLQNPHIEQTIQNAGIKYVIVPYDAEKEIFLKDRKYDGNAYEKTVKTLQSISWLKEIPGFWQIHVFELHNPKSLFWLTSSGNVKYKEISSTEYYLQINNPNSSNSLIFTSSYDSHWVLEMGNKKISPSRFGELTAYSIPKGKYEVRLIYTPQKFVYLGLLISLIAGVAIVLVCVFNRSIYRSR